MLLVKSIQLRNIYTTDVYFVCVLASLGKSVLGHVDELNLSFHNLQSLDHSLEAGEDPSMNTS